MRVTEGWTQLSLISGYKNLRENKELEIYQYYHSTNSFQFEWANLDTSHILFPFVFPKHDVISKC